MRPNRRAACTRMAAKPSIRDIVEANSIPEPNSGCLIWLGWVAGGKYGGKKYPVWGNKSERRQVTRLVLQAKGVDLADTDDACHSCDVSLCVNEDHLFAGTRKINMQDARAKGRLVGYGKREFCKQGHPLSGENLRVDPKSGKRKCYACSLRWGRITDAKRSPRHGH
jgi:hypothetical protein